MRASLPVEASSDGTRTSYRRHICGGPCQRRVDELGRQRVLGGDGSTTPPISTRPAWPLWRLRGCGRRPRVRPAASPNVLPSAARPSPCSSNNPWSSEVGWSGSGGGPSTLRVATVLPERRGHRAIDGASRPGRRLRRIAARPASPSMTPSIYEGDDPTTGSRLAAPAWRNPRSWSALLAIADQGRALTAAAGARQHESAAGDGHPVRKPGRLPRHHHRHERRTPRIIRQGSGYDYVTGLGTPMANQVANSLVGTSTAPYDTLGPHRASPATAGSRSA